MQQQSVCFLSNKKQRVHSKDVNTSNASYMNSNKYEMVIQ